MLIRSEKYGVRGETAKAVGTRVIPAASLPTLPLDGILGGLLLLIGP